MFMISKFSMFLFIPLSDFRKIVYLNLNKCFKVSKHVLFYWSPHTNFSWEREVSRKSTLQ